MRDVLVSARGQADNLGDSVLRRGLLDALRPLGRLVVNVDGLPDGYVGALGLQAQDLLVRDRREWARRSAAGAWGGAVYGFNAGETYATPGYAGHLLKTAPLVALSRLRGGAGLHVGLGLRAPHPLWGRVLNLGLLPVSVVAWRDADSRAWVGRGSVAPDWGYAFGTQDLTAALTGADRPVLAVSLRGDRPAPGPVWTDTVRALAADRSLDVVVVPQVGRDLPRARDLAADLGGELVAWDGIDHAAAEKVVRDVYRRASFVVSDRLHALVLGHTEGALPVGLAPGSAGKLERSLATVGATGVAFSSQDVDVPAALARVDALDARRPELIDAVRRARDSLDGLRGRLRGAVRGTG
ncbi:hypothetical protein HP550_06340 [Cellulomonas humilata]|uniref:Polysaccharide pyruvyl transferase domain-containing protein n=1 Tax=Cellulomonas humilata TaxID=144055 RepID=A0A7Y6DWP6_9CELL|nr:hypothetical protein [Cellulomonas humilata]NUU16868.1 hypothetical protein [Cellulomonas humilata]